MQKADLFAYLAAFVTIVLAIALSDLLLSLHRLLRNRRKVRWDALPLLVALYVYLTILSEFFTLWSELNVERFTFLQLVGEMVVPTLISLMAFGALPDEMPADGLDLTDFYFTQRRYWVVLLGLLMVADITRNLLWLASHNYISDARVWVWLGGLGTAFAAILTTIWRAASRKWQYLALVALNLHGAVAYVSWVVKTDG